MANFAARRAFPEPSPDVCATFFTCEGNGVAGVADLAHTYPAAVRFLDAQRHNGAPLRYELVWLDNGGAPSVVDDFVARGAQLDRIVRNPTNEGVFRAANDVWFRGRGCRAPFVLSLEDDRLPRPELRWDAYLSAAIAVMAADDAVAGVRLKDEFSDAQVAAVQSDDALRPRYVDAGDPPVRVRYTQQWTETRSGLVWGSFSMAGVLYDRRRLLERAGTMAEGRPYDELPYDYAEGQYSVRVAHAGLCTARPHFADACVGDAEGPCHRILVERRQPRARDLSDYEWFFWGTELHVANRTRRAAAEQPPPPTTTPPPTPTPPTLCPTCDVRT